MYLHVPTCVMMLYTCRLLLQDLLCITGSIDTARGDLQGYNGFKKSLQSAQEHNLEHEILTGDEVNARFPGYSLPSNFMVSSWPQPLALMHIMQTLHWQHALYYNNNNNVYLAIRHQVRVPHMMEDMHVQHIVSSLRLLEQW